MTTVPDSQRFCQLCGRPNRPAAAYCASCGSPTQEQGVAPGDVWPEHVASAGAMTNDAPPADAAEHLPPPPPPPAAAAVLAASAASFRHLGPAALTGGPAPWEPGRVLEDAVFTASHLLSIDGASVPVTIFVLADGLSGDEKGNVASQAAVACVADRLLRGLVVPLLAGDAMPLPETIRHEVRTAMEAANDAVRDLCLNRVIRASTTLTAGVLFGGRLTIGHVGDGRVYCVGSDASVVLTSDHTVAAELAAAGVKAERDAPPHDGPESQWVTRAIGREPFVHVDIIEHGLVSGDMLIACTDGVWRPLGQDVVLGLVDAGIAPDAAAAAILTRALAVYRPDDCTVICLRIVGAAGSGVTTTVHGPPNVEAVHADTGDLPRLEAAPPDAGAARDVAPVSAVDPNAAIDPTEAVDDKEDRT